MKLYPAILIVGIAASAFLLFLGLRSFRDSTATLIDDLNSGALSTAQITALEFRSPFPDSDELEIVTDRRAIRSFVTALESASVHPEPDRIFHFPVFSGGQMRIHRDGDRFYDVRYDVYGDWTRLFTRFSATGRIRRHSYVRTSYESYPFARFALRHDPFFRSSLLTEFPPRGSENLSAEGFDAAARILEAIKRDRGVRGR